MMEYLRISKSLAGGVRQRVSDWPLVRLVSRLFASLGDDNIALLAGGVAFYAFLSIFPAIACALMIWGLFTDTENLSNYLNALQGVAPQAAFELIATQMIRIADQQNSGLSWGALISLALTLWSASRAVNALIMAMSVTAGGRPRNFFHQNLMALTFTVVAIFFAVVSLLAIGAVPPIIRALQLGSFAEAAISTIRWLLLLALFFGSLYGFYRVSYRRVAKQEGTRHRVLPGAALATVIWLLASAGFSFFLSSFANYNETFGSLGAVAALLMWFWISAFAVCIGAELNSELPRDANPEPGGQSSA